MIGFNAFNGIEIEILLPSTSPHGCNFELLMIFYGYAIEEKNSSITHEDSIIHISYVFLFNQKRIPFWSAFMSFHQIDDIVLFFLSF